MASIYKEDCKWYDYWQDMGARIPFCKAGKNMDASGFFLETCDECKDYSNKNVITNADHIRTMTDEELAEYILKREIGIVDRLSQLQPFTFKFDAKQGKKDLLNWLKQEADNE